MVKQIIEKLVDDLDGGLADTTVNFAVNGTAYEIDLSDSNAAKLLEALEPFTESGRRIGRAGLPQLVRSSGTARVGAPPLTQQQLAEKTERQAIREWVRGQGLPIAERGAIKREYQEMYRNRHHVQAAANRETKKATSTPARNGKVTTTSSVPAAVFAPPPVKATRGRPAKATAR